VTRNTRVWVGGCIGAAGLVITLVAWQSVRTRSGGSSTERMMESTVRRAPEPLTAWPPAPNGQRLAGVKFRFEDGDGNLVHPDAWLTSESGGEVALAVDGTFQTPVRPVLPGTYALLATSPVSGWEVKEAVRIERDELHRIRFDVPRRSVTVRVWHEDGAPWRGPLSFRATQRPRFTKYSIRKRLIILDISAGIDPQSVTRGRPAWQVGTGPEFGVVCQEGATLLLEVQTTEGYVGHAWFDTLHVTASDAVDVHLREEAVAGVEVSWGGERVGAGFGLQAIDAGVLTNDRWRVRTDRNGRTKIPSFRGGLLPSYLLYAPEESNSFPDSLLVLNDDAQAFISASLMRLPVGASLDFPKYEMIEWRLVFPDAWSPLSPILELWLTARTGNRRVELLPFASIPVPDASKGLLLPSYVATDQVTARLVGPGLDVILTPDLARRVIGVEDTATLEGVVVDGENLPIPGIRLAWARESEGAFGSGLDAFMFRRVATTTDESGRFRLVTAPPEPGVLRSSGGRFKPEAWEFATAPNAPVRLQVSPLGAFGVTWGAELSGKSKIVSVAFPRSGMLRQAVSLGATRTTLPLLDGAGQFEVQVGVPDSGLTIGKFVDLSEGEAIRVEAPSVVSEHALELRTNAESGAFWSRIAWSADETTFEFRERIGPGVASLPRPLKNRRVSLSLFPSRSSTSATSRGSPVYEWTGSASELPKLIDLSAEGDWNCNFIGGAGPVLIQVVDARSRSQQFAVPAGGGSHRISLRAVALPIRIGAVGGLPVRLETRPSALDANALAGTRPVLLSDRLRDMISGRAWSLRLHSGPGWEAATISSTKAAELPAADGSTGWGRLVTEGQESVPVRAFAREGEITVELAGELDE